MKRTVISLYDYTGEAAKPWAQAGYDCVCFDIQHSKVNPRVERYQGGSIRFVHADLHDRAILSEIVQQYKGDVAFMMAFPVCTDLAVSGAAHFDNKHDANPLYRVAAVDHARWCGHVGDALGCPYFIENPVSVLATHWRKSDHSFQPFQYGGYIPEAEADHPTWPDYIAPRDAYPKKTCIWSGGGFNMPEHRPVDCPPGYSDQHKKLGGKSAKTKNIRSATPRGFARAVFEAHQLT
tara:strand:+ start:210 stop:917 length:708 start_codon:yes stop_codon:yes gene_type:complete